MDSYSDDSYDYLSELKSGFNSRRCFKSSFLRRAASIGTGSTVDSDSDDCVIIEETTEENVNKSENIVSNSEDAIQSKTLAVKPLIETANTTIPVEYHSVQSNSQKSNPSPEKSTQHLTSDSKPESKPLSCVKNDTMDVKPDIKPDLDFKPIPLKLENGIKSEESIETKPFDGNTTEESKPKSEVTPNEQWSETKNDSLSSELLSIIKIIQCQHHKPTFDLILVKFKKYNQTKDLSDPISSLRSLLNDSVSKGLVQEIEDPNGEVSFRLSSVTGNNRRRKSQTARKTFESSCSSQKKRKISEDSNDNQLNKYSKLESLRTEEFINISDIDVSSAQTLFGDTELSPHFFNSFKVPIASTSQTSLSLNSTPIKSFNHKRNKEVLRKQVNPDLCDKTPEEYEELLSRSDHPKWLLEPLPRYSPFIGQKGDRVVYMRDAHQIYIDYELKELQELYPKFHSTPEEINAAINSDDYTIKAVITEIKFYQIMSIKFSVIQLKSLSVVKPFEFNVLYRPNRGISEFLVLDYLYNEAMSYNWKAGDQFRSLWKKSWWIGTVLNRSIFNKEYPNSLFKCFEIKWNTEEEGRLSPWDLFLVDDKRLPKRKENGVLITREDLMSVNYRPNFNEWPEVYGLAMEKWRCCECKRIYLAIKFFEKNVNTHIVSLFAEYNHSDIAYPVNLSLIKERLKNMFYRRKESVVRDITFLKTNAKLYVKKCHFKDCEDFVDLLLCVTNDCQSTREEQFLAILESVKYHHLADNSHKHLQSSSHSSINLISSSKELSFNSQKARLPSNSRPEDKSPIKPKSGQKKNVKRSKPTNSQRSIQRSTSYDKEERFTQSTQWKSDSQKFIDQLLNNEESLPYREPVNPELFPYYSRVIDNPIDLSEIQNKLNTNQYINPIALRKDFRLMYENAKAFTNDPKSKMRQINKKLQNLSEDKLREIIVDWERVYSYEQKQNRNVRPREPISRNQLWGYGAQQYY